MQAEQVLAQVAATRQGVQHAVAHIEESRARMQEVVRHAAQRFTQFTAEFDGLRAHLQAETSRVAEAAAGVIEVFGEAQSWATTTASAHDDTLGQLSHESEASTGAHGDGSQALNAHGETAEARKASTLALFEEMLGQVEEGHGSHSQGFQDLQGQLASWKQSTDSESHRQQEAIKASVETEAGEQRQSFEQKLGDAVQTAQQEIEDHERKLGDHTNQQVEHLTREENQHRSDVTDGLNAMREALQKLGDLVGDTSETLSKGADQATDLMDAANVGVDTVIGLIENLSAIFDEIENAWSNG